MIITTIVQRRTPTEKNVRRKVVSGVSTKIPTTLRKDLQHKIERLKTLGD